tara:strand:- start:213 stop:1415 length:1203 start_codon:yes stop_codon:yes gene_type:complete
MKELLISSKYLQASKKNNIEQILDRKFSRVINNYNKKYYFSSARMGVYFFLKNLPTDNRNEVIVTAFTCSVLVNAVIRANYKPIFCDIDKTNFSTCLYDLEKKITDKTKAIIIQHTFGYMANIDNIFVEKIKKNKIFIIEDCALTISSKNKINYSGSFGDAAVYSFDRSKPISVLIGGCLVINNPSLIYNFENCYKNIKTLAKKKQKHILYQILIDKIFLNNNLYFLWKIINYLSRNLLIFFKPYFDEDTKSTSKMPSYDYPSKMPQSIKYLLIKGIDNYKNQYKTQNKFKEKYQYLINKISTNNYVSSSYENCYFLRYCFIVNNKKKLLNKLSSIIDTKQIWFDNNIINTSENIANYGYIHSSCPNAELVCSSIINLPGNLSDKRNIDLLKKLEMILEK